MENTEKIYKITAHIWVRGYNAKGAVDRLFGEVLVKGVRIGCITDQKTICVHEHGTPAAHEATCSDPSPMNKEKPRMSSLDELFWRD
jgi:hypothetical protein